jgi:RNA polymerase sigma-70 factor, ECF subfamily
MVEGLRALEPRREFGPGAGEKPAAINDEALVVRAAGGDRWAEEALVRRHGAEVLRLATRLLGSVQDADDVAQEAFLAAFVQLPKLRTPGAFRSWLLRITVNQARRAIRRRRLRRVFGLDRTVEDATLEVLASGEVRPETRTELAALGEVLRRLPTDLRVAWLLRHVEGHSVADVGRLCSCSLATIKRRLARAEARVSAVVDLEVL